MKSAKEQRSDIAWDQQRFARDNLNGHSRMFTLKAVTYSATIAAAMFFGFWELRLKRQLTDTALELSKAVSDFGIVNLSERLKREEILRGLPKQAKFKLRTVVILKFVFIAILIMEVVILQR